MIYAEQSMILNGIFRRIIYLSLLCSNHPSVTVTYYLWSIILLKTQEKCYICSKDRKWIERHLHYNGKNYVSVPQPLHKNSRKNGNGAILRLQVHVPSSKLGLITNTVVQFFRGFMRCYLLFNPYNFWQKITFRKCTFRKNNFLKRSTAVTS